MREIIRYYIDAGLTKRSDSSVKRRIVGPFHAQILGHYWREEPVSDEEVREYVRKMHGTDPCKIERSAVGSRKGSRVRPDPGS